MTLTELKDKVIGLDPDKVVSAEMDNFDPYLSFDIPGELLSGYEQLGDEDKRLYEEWEVELLERLRTDGRSGWLV